MLFIFAMCVCLCGATLTTMRPYETRRRITTVCNPLLFPFPPPIANLTRCPRVSHPWAPPSISVNASVEISGATPAICTHPGKCSTVRAVGHVFIIEDRSSLGHMMMSFTSLFSWLARLTLEEVTDEATAIWGSDPTDHGGSKVIRDVFFTPMLHSFINFFGQKSMKIDVLDHLNQSHKGCYKSKSCAVRNCVMHNHQIPTTAHGTTGHCASWFSDPSSVGLWRTMLSDELKIHVPTHNCHRDTQKWAHVLIYARPTKTARAWKNAQRLAEEVHRHLSAAWDGVGILVQVHFHKEDSWASQCRLFSQYDLIVGVHGAGLTNLVCARPCAMIIEVAWSPYTFITVLASHIGIHHCAANVSTALWKDGKAYSNFFNGDIEPADITTCLNQFVAIHRQKMTQESHKTPKTPANFPLPRLS
jgi:hypothetical protein